MRKEYLKKHMFKIFERKASGFVSWSEEIRHKTTNREIRHISITLKHYDIVSGLPQYKSFWFLHNTIIFNVYTTIIEVENATANRSHRSFALNDVWWYIDLDNFLIGSVIRFLSFVSGIWPGRTFYFLSVNALFCCGVLQK